MGYMRHHAIVVTSYSDAIGSAWACAAELFNDTEARVSAITEDAVNGYRSFFIAPDGSKEGWPESEAVDDARKSFLNWLNQQRNDDGSTPLAYAEVQFHDERRDDRLLRSSQMDREAG